MTFSTKNLLFISKQSVYSILNTKRNAQSTQNLGCTLYKSHLLFINVYLRYVQKKTLNRLHIILLVACNGCFQKQINGLSVTLHFLVSKAEF